MFSLRHEFPAVLAHLVHEPLGRPAKLELAAQHFLLFLQGRARATSARKVFVTDGSKAMTGVAFKVNSVTADQFPAAEDSLDPGRPFGGLPSKSLGAALGTSPLGEHTLTAASAGSLAGGSGQGSSPFDPNRLKDVLLVVKYLLA